MQQIQSKNMKLTKLYLQVFVIGKDFGAVVAYAFALLHRERVLGVVTLGVPFIPPGPLVSHESLPEGFYISRFRVRRSHP